MPKEKTILVTGGARGIGSAIASAFASEGSTVWVTDRYIDNAELRDGNTAGVRLETLDVSDQAAIQRFVDTLDSLDILVNCAGIILRENQEHEVEGFQRVIDINLVGTMRMCTACKPLLAESSGCVLNVASMLSLFGSGFVPAYSASKGGIVQLTKSLAIAWARDGIRVNAIAPGWIETAMTHSLSTDPERHRAIVDRTPMRRWGKPKDLAGAALFLCSSQAAFITGAILPIDGGYSCV
ncbi:MAG: SDR family oxidoreductase [Verrucomicrobia bacterium]|nr:SDR family oxidoreductase [Verrucomicrobiota bacterium]